MYKNIIRSPAVTLTSGRGEYPIILSLLNLTHGALNTAVRQTRLGLNELIINRKQTKDGHERRGTQDTGTQV